MRIRARITSTFGSLLASALLGVAIGCAPATQDAAPVQRPEAAATAEYFKIDLAKDTAEAGGTVEVVGFHRVETSGLPLAAAFEYLAVAYAGDEVVAAMPFSFPGTGHREWMDAEGRYTRSKTIPLPETTTSVMLPDAPGLTRIDVADARGTVLLSLDPGDAEATVADDPGIFIRRAFAAESTMIGHIQIVSDINLIPGMFHITPDPDNSLVDSLHVLDDDETTALTNALAQLPPRLHGAIARISIANYENGGCAAPGPCDDWVAGDAYGNAIILNRVLLDGQQDLLLDTLAHEAVHCFHALVDQSNDLQFDADYNVINVLPEAVQAAENARGRLLHGSINRVLQRLQTSATIAHSEYKDYAGAAWSSTYGGDAESVRDAFATPYGSEEPREDLAELVKIFVAGDYASHPMCTQFQGLDKEVPGHVALAFAKLNFARGLGILDEGLYTQCVGQADPVDGEMIVMGSRNYEQDLNVGMQTVSHEDLDFDWIMIRIQGVTDDAQLEIRARVRKASDNAIGTPIGFYELDTAGSYGMAADRLIPIAAQNVITFQRTNTSNPTELAAYTRISGGGFMLITDFSKELVQGYVFFPPFHSIIELQPPPTDVLDVIWFSFEQ